ncbi:MAG TPA: phage portal protein [Tepidisphaeraceae bacterium]|jgi:capsid protein|nr:phage portal protein [Tepidisphaeraceae bacterium]
MPRTSPNAIASFGAMKAEYQGMVENRFRRRRPGVNSIGTHADTHYANEAAFIKMREYGRAADRDDTIVGMLYDRAADNQTQTGYTPKPNTGDPEVDAMLYVDKWLPWATDKDMCDASGTQTFPEMEWSVARADMADGDVLALPIDDGSLQLIEAHRLRTPANSKRNIVHGVELDDRRRRLRYYFAPEDVSPQQRFAKVGDARIVPAYDADGNPQVFHVYRPSRFSQTRGVLWLKGVLDLLTQIEDTTFATSVKQQIAACAVWSWDRDPAATYGADNVVGEREQQQIDAFTRAINEGVSPGQMYQPPPGTKLNIHSPNLPGDNFIPHQRMLMSLVGVQVGVPLFMMLLDPSEGSFSSLRVAWDQAILGFVKQQYRRIGQFYTPLWRWKIRQWIAEDPRVARAAAKLGDRIFSHQWNPPGWKYLQPMQEAAAFALQVQTWQTSLTRRHAENGDDFKEVAREIVADNEFGITLAIEAAERLKTKFKDAAKDVHWTQLYHRDYFKGGQLIDTLETPNDGSSTKAIKDGSASAPSPGQKK